MNKISIFVIILTFGCAPATRPRPPIDETYDTTPAYTPNPTYTPTPNLQASNNTDSKMAAYRATLPEPNANYGSFPMNYDALIKAYMEDILKDPESARYSHFTFPRKEHAIEKHRAIYGYSSCVMINAKNSYGGHTGNTLFWFFFQNGQIIRMNNVSEIDIIYIGHPINCEDGPPIPETNNAQENIQTDASSQIPPPAPHVN